MSRRKLEVLIGVSFVVQLLTAAVGNTLVQNFVNGDPDRTALAFGALLMMLSGIIIATLGILLYRVLEETNKALATWILIIRITECTVAQVFGIYLLATSRTVTDHLLWVYVLAGAAGLVLCYVLLTSKLVPRPIAALGGLGYTVLLLGVPLDVAGIIDMNLGLGQMLFIPGGLFEVVVLPLWLIAEGLAPAERPPRKIHQDALA